MNDKYIENWFRWYDRLGPLAKAEIDKYMKEEGEKYLNHTDMSEQSQGVLATPTQKEEFTKTLEAEGITIKDKDQLQQPKSLPSAKKRTWERQYHLAWLEDSLRHYYNKMFVRKQIPLKYLKNPTDEEKARRIYR